MSIELFDVERSIVNLKRLPLSVDLIKPTQFGHMIFLA
ncbi:hypothetical protein PAMC26577_39100 [Caballeronia sordidicola]|jgi:hypothetical protein|uniref:Uncharacterized protein n=1 Tax=Caballeronia sordidicola TaxID=196367 RepID=A0A242M3J7_CABSO|nr:hypothetical protein PAMC26577_39100 [Caballeronia sordidicola]